jgi:predicted phage baseplate assembly protein
LNVQNRPGLSAIAYRVGQYATFRESMLAALSSGEFRVRNLRAALQTREPSDFSIALLDAWASVADVLTFYQERIANEHYLRTATELRSLNGLADLVGYQLRPGLAAATYVAFLVDDPPVAALASLPGINLPKIPRPSLDGFVTVTSVPSGAKIQSVPGPGQLPQTFETVKAIGARIEWNNLQPRLTRPYLSINSPQFRLQGVATGLQRGDMVFVGYRSGVVGPKLAQVVDIQLDDQRHETIVNLSESGPQNPPPVPSQGSPPPDGTPLTAAVIQTMIMGTYWDQTLLVRAADRLGWDLDDFATLIREALAALPPTVRIAKAGIAARAFGHNAPDWGALPFNLTHATLQSTVNGSGGVQTVTNPAAYPTDWTSALQTASATSSLLLDNTYKGISPGAWIAADNNGSITLTTVHRVREQGVSNYSLHATVTGIEVLNSLTYSARGARIHIATPDLPIAEERITNWLDRTMVILDGPSLWLQLGQPLILTGELATQPGVTVSEVAAIGTLELFNGRTLIRFERPLANDYLLESVRINANVAPATHGETRAEVLGSGDATQVFQKFVLKHPPLTYLSASNAAGAESTIQVYVNDVRWEERPTLYAAGPNDRVFIIRHDTQGNTYVQFGDGLMGSRLPTGVENVQAVYRQGLGAAGLLEPGQLRLLLTRPLGIKDVASPLAPEGGADPETVPDAQFNAPLSVRTLGRIVSLDDFDDFARASAGIARAQATWLWDGRRRVVALTVAGPKGASLTGDSAVMKNLNDAIAKAGDPNVPVAVASYRIARFRAAVSLRIDPDRITRVVVENARAALESAFSFQARQLGQPVTLAEVYAVAQSVPGVVAAKITQFCRSDFPVVTVEAALVANGPSLSGGGLLGAEMLLIEPGVPDLGVMP